MTNAKDAKASAGPRDWHAATAHAPSHTSATGNMAVFVQKASPIRQIEDHAKSAYPNPIHAHRGSEI